jgi:phosphohistidine phosphatase
MRRLILVRHAHAEAAAADDRSRALSPRGRAEAAALGRWLVGARIEADRALVSPARRAAETWRLAVEAGAAGPAATSAGLYGATPDGLLALLRGGDGGIRTLALVGHNPALQELAAMLLADAPGGAAVASSFPPATAAVLGFAAAAGWADVAPGGAALEGFVTPRLLGTAGG